MQGRSFGRPTGGWITKPPTRCPNGRPLARTRCWWVIRPAWGMAAVTPHGPAVHASRRCGDPGRTKPLPKAAQSWPSMKSGTQTLESYTDRRALCQPGRRPRMRSPRAGVSHRKMMTMRLPYLRRNRAGYVMGASTVVVALAGVGSFLAVGNRDHESRVSERARRFLTWLREEF